MAVGPADPTGFSGRLPDVGDLDALVSGAAVDEFVPTAHTDAAGRIDAPGRVWLGPNSGCDPCGLASGFGPSGMRANAASLEAVRIEGRRPLVPTCQSDHFSCG